jgi:serine/threonine protein kinase
MLHIQRKQFSLRQAKFYASEVLLALEYFHANGIIYRYAQPQCTWGGAHRLILLQ